MANLDGTDEFFDSRDVTERIEEIEAGVIDGRELDYEFNPEDIQDEDEREEYDALIALQEEALDYIADWADGATFIADDHFEDYARELAEDIGAYDPDAGWPNAHIDWAAAAESLRMDYTEFEFRGTTYWAR